MTDWWSSKTAIEFESKAKCYEYQYGNYSIQFPSGTENVNGLLTLGENLADAGGIVRAFEAWKETKANEKMNFKLPGLQSYTLEQLFFISFGQIWCSLTKDAAMLRRVSRDIF